MGQTTTCQLVVCPISFFAICSSRFQLSPKKFYGIETRTHCYPKHSIFPFSAIPVCFWLYALGLSCAEEPIIFHPNFVFLHWVAHFTLFHQSLNTFKASSTRGAQTAPQHQRSSTMPDCRLGVYFIMSFVNYKQTVGVHCQIGLFWFYQST